MKVLKVYLYIYTYIPTFGKYKIYKAIYIYVSTEVPAEFTRENAGSRKELIGVQILHKNHEEFVFVSNFQPKKITLIGHIYRHKLYHW